MSAGLAASTVTPGSTAPVASVTMPAIALVCAKLTVGNSEASTATNAALANPLDTI
jgi:hypothetical protein